MQVVDVEDAFPDFAELLQKAEHGETILISRNGTPVVQISQVTKPQRLISRRDGFGFLRGKSAILDDIKAPFEAEIDSMFNGNPDKFSL